MARKHRTSVRVGVYNLGDGSDSEKFQDLLGLMGQRFDYLGLTEHADRSDVTDRFVRNFPQYGKWEGDGRNGAQKTCVIYRKSKGRVTAKVSNTLTGRKRLPQGAGPEQAGPKVANRIRARVEKKRLHFIVAHEYASVNNRREAAAEFMRALVAIVRPRLGKTIVVADFNMTATHRLMRALRALLKSRSKVGPTHDTREIDQILTNGEIYQAWTWTGTSDHKAVFADVYI